MVPWNWILVENMSHLVNTFSEVYVTNRSLTVANTGNKNRTSVYGILCLSFFPLLFSCVTFTLWSSSFIFIPGPVSMLKTSHMTSIFTLALPSLVLPYIIYLLLPKLMYLIDSKIQWLINELDRVAILENLILAQIATKSLLCMKPEVSLPHSQEPPNSKALSDLLAW